MKDLYCMLAMAGLVVGLVIALIISVGFSAIECHDKGGTYVRDAGCVKLEKLR